MATRTTTILGSSRQHILSTDWSEELGRREGERQMAAPDFDLSTFDYHKPTEEQLGRIAQIRDAFKRMATVIMEVAPPSRHRSLAFTHLEDGCMRAVKAVVLEER